MTAVSSTNQFFSLMTKILKTKSWPDGRKWPDEITLDVGSSMPTDVHGVYDSDWGVLYVRHDVVAANEKLLWQKLKDLQGAVRKHAAEMDSIMAGPASHERGQKIALSLGRLEQALRDSASTSPGSEVKADSGLPEPTVSPSPPAASTPALKKRKRRSSIS